VWDGTHRLGFFFFFEEPGSGLRIGADPIPKGSGRTLELAIGGEGHDGSGAVPSGENSSGSH